MATIAVYDNGVLVVVGDGADNNISISRDLDGALVVTSSLAPITIVNAPVGGATVGNTTSILVYGLEGNDVLQINEQNGPLPFAYLGGGDGADTLVGGAAVNWLDGGAGNDGFLGRGGADYIFSNPGDSDSSEWTVGEGADFIDDFGGSLLANGTGGVNTISVIGGGEGLGYIFNNETNELVAKQGMGSVGVKASGGNDVISVTGVFLGGDVIIEAGSGDDIVIVDSSKGTNLHGDEGADYLVGGSGGDSLFGGSGVDILTGGGGGDGFTDSNTAGEFDFIADFNVADLILFEGDNPLAVQAGAHVIVGTESDGFTHGFIVLNAIAAEVQGRVI